MNYIFAFILSTLLSVGSCTLFIPQTTIRVEFQNGSGTSTPTSIFVTNTPLAPSPTATIILPDPTPTRETNEQLTKWYGVTTAGAGLNLRRCPLLTCEIIIKLPINTLVEVDSLTSNDQWYQVTVVSDGETGWVSAQYVTPWRG